MSKLKLTFEDYIKNPAGKGSSINPSRDTTAQFYETKFNALVARDGLMKYEVYRTASDVYYIHFHIHSNSTKGFDYDAVVELRPNKDDTQNSKANLRAYLVRFYSNDPDFNFTHAHAYLTHGLIIPEFEKKISLQVKTMKASTRNPDNTISYVQSIYFAYIIMNKDNLFDKSIIDRKAATGGYNRFGSSVPSYSNKEKEKQKYIEDLKHKAQSHPDQVKTVLKPKIISSRFIGNGLSHIPIVSKVTGTSRSSNKSHTVKTTKTTKKR